MRALTALLFFFAACGGEETTPPTQTDASVSDSGFRCATDSECPNTLICNVSAGLCEAPVCVMDTDCGDGRTCVREAGCTRAACPATCEPKTCTDHPECGEWVCLSGTCAEPPSCASAACPAGLSCGDDQLCRPTQVVPCADDTTCAASGQICVMGQCVVGQACNNSNQCPSALRCIRSFCRDPCTTNEQCGMGLTIGCDTASGECRDRCLGDDDCGAGNICNSNFCYPAECAQDSECNSAAGEICVGEENGHGRCSTFIPCPMGNECPMNFGCVMGRCEELPGCISDRDCGLASYCQDRHCQEAMVCTNMSCGDGLECVGGRCVPGGCRGANDCSSNEVCVAGSCVAPVATNSVASVRILSPAATLRTGQTYRFVAVAQDAQGALIAGVPITWTADAQVATFNGNLATAVGPGTTQVTASVGAITSQSVALTAAAAPTGFQVTVTAEATGLPVANATVVCNQETLTTPASGVLSFNATVPKTCSVFHPDHDWLTVSGLSGPDVVLRIPQRSRSNASTGYRGSVDTSQLPGSAPVTLSFSGASWASPLSAQSPLALFGGDIFRVEIPILGGINLPAGTTVRASVGGLGEFDLKASYNTTVGGLRRAWTFGGKAELADLDLRGGNFLGRMLPLFQTFQHGSRNRLDTLLDLPWIVDAADIDGDGDTSESVPDWDSFLEAPLTPNAATRLRFQVEPGSAALPAGTNSIIVVAGAHLPSVGFVPLGLDGTDLLSSFSSAVVPAYDGLEAGDYGILIAAVNITQGALPTVTSAYWAQGEQLPDRVDLSAGFLAFPTAAFNSGTRALSITSPAGAEVWRARFRSPEGSWHVYGPATETAFTLPAAPAGQADRLGNVSVESLDLRSGGVDGLFAPGYDGLSAERLTQRFSQLSLP